MIILLTRLNFKYLYQMYRNNHGLYQIWSLAPNKPIHKIFIEKLDN